MKFKKFGEWVSLREEQMVPPAPIKPGSMLVKPATNTKATKAVIELVKKKGGGVKPGEAAAAVAKVGGSQKEIMQAAKDASELS
jgi:hypothetical protein